jgi:glycosyltransferase involved in cell wall biosynthesis
LSSESVKKDWECFYPQYKGTTTVVNFAVTHPEFESLDIEMLREKFNLPVEYFFSPNQFWAHKNHIVVIKAAQILKQKGKPVVIAFSGKENDNRNPGYTEELKKYVADNQLEDVVRFLGFLDRREQLKLMKNAKAVIQPSLFEGWSTVIEDAMAMNQVVIASDLEVNLEQLGGSGWFFHQTDPIHLAEQMTILLNESPRINYNYVQKRNHFGQTINTIVNHICAE